MDSVAPQSVSRIPVEPSSPRIFRPPAPVDNPHSRRSTIFIVPMEGFENYLAQPFRRKTCARACGHEQQARYVLKAPRKRINPAWAKMVMMKQSTRMQCGQRRKILGLGWLDGNTAYRLGSDAIHRLCCCILFGSTRGKPFHS